MQRQLFPSSESRWTASQPKDRAVDISQQHLRDHGLLKDPNFDSSKPPPAVEFDLPKMQGPTLAHHFHALGRQAAEPYLSISTALAEATDLPSMPEVWTRVAGWTHYHPDGSCEQVDYPPPEDEALVFDVETLPYQSDHFPILAVAVGKLGWYSWCSPWLTGDDDEPNHLIPFAPTTNDQRPDTLFEPEQERPRVIIGHNVSFDRARVQSEYTLRRRSTRWIDTLSLHVAVSGLTNPQRPAWLKYRKEKQDEENRRDVARAEGVQLPPAADAEGVQLPPAADAEEQARDSQRGLKVAKKKKTSKTWHEMASANSLSEVARLHCGIKMDKSTRDILIDPATTLQHVRDFFDTLMQYCANDVKVTLDVYQALLPKFRASCPHPVSFAGILLMSQPVLPVDRNWPQYLQRAESSYQDRLQRVKDALRTLAEEARAKAGQRDEKGNFAWQNDIWLRQLDWSPKKARRLGSSVSNPSPPAQPVRKKRKTISNAPLVPAWYSDIIRDERGTMMFKPTATLLPVLLRTSWRSFPVVFSRDFGWLYAVPTSAADFKPEPRSQAIATHQLSDGDMHLRSLSDIQLWTIPGPGKSGLSKTLLGPANVKKMDQVLLGSPFLSQLKEIAFNAKERYLPAALAQKLAERAESIRKLTSDEIARDPWLSQLDWSPVQLDAPVFSSSTEDTTEMSTDLDWPKWYWELASSSEGLDMSIGKRAAPLLLKLRWRGYPILYSKEHGWIYRVPVDKVAELQQADSTLKALQFEPTIDCDLAEDETHTYFKLPHPDGEGKNVGTPLAKSFVVAFEEGVLTSEYPIAADALALNASCSYWESSRERINDQMVVWEADPKAPVPTPSHIAAHPYAAASRGLILPQVVPMGTITRRAVERTWLTASNAKKNRVGSELKAMVRSPPGYAIVGADVDSEELWICSVMGDAQFGLHGATAIGWMTLEGTKSAGTDLHSKTASILGISRDHAKVFNYSRIYGAGVKHAVTLLLKSNPRLHLEEATRLARELYAATKGLTNRSPAFGRTFWYGGSESFVFNKLEEIAKSSRPVTPALGCGLTTALTKAYLPADDRHKAGEAYMPSRINWVVQSSGVDYLHLLLVSMEYLTKRFDIDARYMISVHDEVRYLVKEEDKHRAALALQVANIWTRAMFSFRLQIDNLPQSCAFFSAVDVDHCFRKESNMTCLTPSNPDSIPFGSSHDISETLALTSNGSLFKDGQPMSLESERCPDLPVPELTAHEVHGEKHRSDGEAFLRAQTLKEKKDVVSLWKSVVETSTRDADDGLVRFDSSGSESGRWATQHDLQEMAGELQRAPFKSNRARNKSSGKGAGDDYDVPDDVADDLYETNRSLSRASA